MAFSILWLTHRPSFATLKLHIWESSKAVRSIWFHVWNWNKYGGNSTTAHINSAGTCCFLHHKEKSMQMQNERKNWKSWTCWMIFSSMPWWHILKWERSLHERSWNFCLTRSFEIWKWSHRNPMGDWIRISAEDPLLSCHYRQPQSEIRRGFWKVKESIRNLYL